MTMRSQLALVTAVVAFVTVANVRTTHAGVTTDAAVRNDPELSTALVNDPELARQCLCIVGARWIDESYPRVTVRAAAYARLDPTSRMRFGKRILHVAEATYLAENAAVDQYDELFIVDERGRSLASGRP